MAQKSYLALKRIVKIDGEELFGLSRCSQPKDAENTVDVPTFGRLIPIKTGVKKFDPITLVYSVAKDSKTYKFFHDWFTQNAYHDVDVLDTDATGAEFDRWSLRDCECHSFEVADYDAATPGNFIFTAIVICNTAPVRRDPA